MCLQIIIMIIIICSQIMKNHTYMADHLKGVLATPYPCNLSTQKMQMHWLKMTKDRILNRYWTYALLTRVKMRCFSHFVPKIRLSSGLLRHGIGRLALPFLSFFVGDECPGDPKLTDKVRQVAKYKSSMASLSGMLGHLLSEFPYRTVEKLFFHN